MTKIICIGAYLFLLVVNAIWFNGSRVNDSDHPLSAILNIILMLVTALYCVWSCVIGYAVKHAVKTLPNPNATVIPSDSILNALLVNDFKPSNIKIKHGVFFFIILCIFAITLLPQQHSMLFGIMVVFTIIGNVGAGWILDGHYEAMIDYRERLKSESEEVDESDDYYYE